MATKVVFGNKIIEEPGVYSQIKSGIKNPPLTLSYGNILIIDTGKGAGFGSGSGIDGGLYQDKEAIQEFTEKSDFKSAVGGGLYYGLATPLFTPKQNIQAKGVSKIFFVKAATTTPAEMLWDFEGSGVGGGIINIKVKDEGLCGNGKTNETLAKAYVKINNIGVAGDTIELVVDETLIVHDSYYNGGLGTELFSTTLGSYTIQNGDTMASVIANLIQAINALTGTHNCVASSYLADTFCITAPEGSGILGNDYILSNIIVGAITTTLTQFTGGADSSQLLQGYAGQMLMSPDTDQNNPTAFIIKFLRGTFTGYDHNGKPYDGIEKADSNPNVVAISPEFSDITTLVNWMKTNSDFNSKFKYVSHTINGTGTITADDLTNYASLNLAYGGTETYTQANLDRVLNNIAELDYTFVFSTDYGTGVNDGAKCLKNTKIYTHINEEAIYDKYMIVGAGNDKNDFTYSIQTAEYYNTSKVIVVHAGYKLLKNDGINYTNYPVIYKTAAVLGRIAGLPPQVPATFKSIDMDADMHDMSEKERKLALRKGVLHTKFDIEFGEFIINQAITSIQKNDFLMNEDAQSYEISIERIKAQLNKELVYNAKNQLLRQENGVNRFTLSTQTVINWTKGFLQTKTASGTEDNLILGFKDVTVKVYQDTYFINYGFYPNMPVNKLLFTGTALDPFSTLT